jgi:suppressor of G2 allele of SKP1
MATHAANGKAALDRSDYETAASQFTIALKDNPTSPLWLIQRSTAYQRLGKHELSLVDADNAVLAARARARRELIAQAQFRRAVALHGLKRFGDARLCLTWTRKMDEKMKALGMWQAKVVKDFDDAGGEGAPGNQTAVMEYPEKVEKISSAPKDTKVDEKKYTKEEKGKMPEVTVAPVVTATPKEKIRHEFYQSTDKLTITVFAKGMPKDKGEVIIKEGSVSIHLLCPLIQSTYISQLEISFPVLDSNSTYDLSFDPLFARVDPSKSSYRITPHKIEIILHKSIPGSKWPSLEGTEPIVSSNTEDAPTVPAHVLSPSTNTEKAPQYPTSSRHGPKDWDALATTALKSASAENGDNVADLNDDDNEGGDAMNDFFKKLYKDADPDTKRAMMKSFQESNGTALSTNWAEVGKETVKTQPPDGVEAKKWGT